MRNERISSSGGQARGALSCSLGPLQCGRGADASVGASSLLRRAPSIAGGKGSQRTFRRIPFLEPNEISRIVLENPLRLIESYSVQTVLFPRRRRKFLDAFF